MSERLTIGTGLGALDALRILDAAAEAARDVPDGYALREAVLCAVEALRGERAAEAQRRYRAVEMLARLVVYIQESIGAPEPSRTECIVADLWQAYAVLSGRQP